MGKEQIVIEGKDDWVKNAAILPKKSGLQTVNLLIDSTDFHLCGKASISRKDPSWSYKLNAPGQCFQIACDSHGKIQQVWGGYSPKVYDGNWVRIVKEILSTEFNGAHFIVDTHYKMTIKQ